jgi:aspartyl protease
MTTRPLAPVLLALLACAHRGAAGSGAPAGDAVTVPLKTYAGRLVTVDVELKGVTAPFLVDTSGGLTVLTPEAAQRIGCAGPPIVAMHADGEHAELPRCGAVGVTIGGQRLESEAAVFDFSKVLPRDAPPVGGVIGLGTLEGRPFTLELAARRLTFESEASLAARVRDAQPLRVRVQRAAMGVALDLFVAVRGVGGPLWFQLDSTNLGDVVVSRQALPALAIPDEQGRALAGGKHGTIELQVEGLGALPVHTVAGDLIYDGVLSAEAVEMLAITVDLRAGKAWAKRAAAKGDAADL